jgi:tRNA threonylcarbamoyladenosine dehydratase
MSELSPALSATYLQRFGGIARLYGQQTLPLLQQAHFAVIGIGGVGTWVAEALARTGVGTLTLIDMDDVCITNTNRQSHALQSTIGQIKTTAMAARLRDINPEIVVHEIAQFVSIDNVRELLTREFNVVIDAADSAAAKAAIIACCRRNKIAVISVGSAGGKTDPRQITSGDLSRTTADPLLSKVRQLLRRFYNFPKNDSPTNAKRRFAVEAVYSEEAMRYPQPDGTVCAQKSAMEDGVKLDCSGGFGSVTMVTASFGMVAAARAVEKYLTKIHPSPPAPLPQGERGAC